MHSMHTLCTTDGMQAGSYNYIDMHSLCIRTAISTMSSVSKEYETYYTLRFGSFFAHPKPFV